MDTDFRYCAAVEIRPIRVICVLWIRQYSASRSLCQYNLLTNFGWRIPQVLPIIIGRRADVIAPVPSACAQDMGDTYEALISAWVPL